MFRYNLFEVAWKGKNVLDKIENYGHTEDRKRSRPIRSIHPALATNKMGAAVKVGALSLLAYIIGWALSPYIVPVDILSQKLAPFLPSTSNGAPNTSSAPTPVTLPPVVMPKQPTVETNLKYAPSYKKLIGMNAQRGDPFEGVDIIVHRNGEPDPCARQQTVGVVESESPDVAGNTLSYSSKALLKSAELLYHGYKPLDVFQKYDVDAVLTHALAVGIKGSSDALLEGKGSTCKPTWEQEKHFLNSAPDVSEMLKFCDMGKSKTPIQPDHSSLVQVPGFQSLPCHFHTREGVRITSLQQLAQFARGAKVPVENGECKEEDRNVDGSCGTNTQVTAEGGRRELHLYAVQAGRVFIFAPKYVGEIFELPHVEVPNNLPVWLEVISLKPRVFDIFNFFDKEESKAIVDKAIAETSETHRMKRSSTGASGYNVNSQRTSENGFDTHGKEAQAVKHRCMEILGFDEYIESFTDGLQVLRYNKTTAYIPHLDWIDDYHKKEEHNYDSAGIGSNRFATILLYMSDLGEGDGGETVFVKGWPPGQSEEERVQLKDALASLRESGDVTGLLKEGSWEEKMVANCRSRLAVRPHSSRAALFYSQNPDGSPDEDSLHGGCPVINREKWAANLWVWNAPRGGFPGAPVNKHVVDKNRAAGKSPDQDLQKKASFTNAGSDEGTRNAKLYFQDTFWGELGHNSPQLNVNTYEGHQWNVKVGDDIIKTFVIDKKPTQNYVI